MSAMTHANYVKRMFNQPCNAPSFEIVIQTAFQAAAPVIIEYFTYGCFDILKQRGNIGDGAFEKLKGQLETPWPRVKKGERTPCGRGMTGSIKQIRAFKELGNAGAWWASGPLQVSRGLWYSWIADLGGQFLMQWQSLMYQEQGCDLPISGYVSCGVSTIFTDNPNPSTAFINCLESQPCIAIGGNQITIPAGCRATITWQMEWEPFDHQEANRGTVRSWLEDGDGHKYSEMTSRPGSRKNPANTGGGINKIRSIAGHEKTYKLMFAVESGLMGCAIGHVSISTEGKPITLVPPGCNPGGRFAEKKHTGGSVAVLHKPKPGVKNPK